MAATASQVKTWSAFYHSNRQRIPTLQAKYEMTFANYNDMTQALGQIGDELVLRMATPPHNFIILPGSTVQGKILLLHHCFTVSETGECPILLDGFYGDVGPDDATQPDTTQSNLGGST
jgi:hypothetical protein